MNMTQVVPGSGCTWLRMCLAQLCWLSFAGSALLAHRYLAQNILAKKKGVN